MITAGVDIGAKYVKVVVLKDKQPISKVRGTVGFDVAKSALDAFEQALKGAGITRGDVERVFATGMGRKAVHLKPPINADEAVPEVVADAAGVIHVVPTARTVIDVGAEEGRGVKVDPTGKVKDFVINERCAAGAGTFVEAMARALEVPLEQMGPLSLKSQRTIPMNAQCTIFAESEVVSLIHAKVSKEDIARAIHDAMAGRIGSMVRRIGIEKDVVLVGGVGNNVGFVASLKRELGVDIIVPEGPEYISALGAALIASSKA
ncbi:MAG: acyl-CoA dehydratase activase [Candidatus Nezhaarchaeales archaeon]